MKKMSKLFIGIQTVVLMSAVAVPAQAAVLIGGTQPLSGSVVTLKSSAPTTTQVSSAPTSQWTQTSASAPTTIYVVGSSPTSGGNVVSLKNVNQPTTIPSTSTSIPTSSQGTQTTVSTPTTTTAAGQTVTIGQPNTGGNVVSLKNINQQPTSVPVTVTPTPTPTPTNPPSTTPSLPTIPTVTAITAEEQQMVDMINQERAAAGVSPVQVDLRLVSVGQAKANDMKANNYFDHTSPTYGSPWAMMQQVGLTVGWAGENIAGNNSVSGAMAAFMQSPGHKANILDPRFTHVGVGIAYGSAYGNLYVQEFLQE